MQGVKVLELAAGQDSRVFQRIPGDFVDGRRFGTADGDQRHFQRHRRIGLAQIQQGRAQVGGQRQEVLLQVQRQAGEGVIGAALAEVTAPGGKGPDGDGDQCHQRQQYEAKAQLHRDRFRS